MYSQAGQTLTNNECNVLWRRGNGQLVVESAPLGTVCPLLLDQLAAADGHLAGWHSEVQLKGAGSKGLVHAWEPGPCATQLQSTQ